MQNVIKLMSMKRQSRVVRRTVIWRQKLGRLYDANLALISRMASRSSISIDMISDFMVSVQESAYHLIHISMPISFIRVYLKN